MPIILEGYKRIYGTGKIVTEARQRIFGISKSEMKRINSFLFAD